MKTQKIVLALALVAVTPAVLSAQDYVGGPGSKMLYIADNALARIRQNDNKNKQQKPVTPKQKPVQTKKDTSSVSPVNAYIYGGREGHAYLAGELTSERIQKRQSNNRKNTSTNSNANRSNKNNGHSPYIDLKNSNENSTNVPTHVKDIDTVSTNNKVILDSKTADKNAKKTNSSFRQWWQVVGEAITREAPYMK